MAAHTETYTYIMPDNQEEIDRLRNQHDWVKDSTGGKLIFAPIHQNGAALKVLDSATADGYWCIDAAKELPLGTSLVGFDIADHLFLPPEQLPTNLDLELVRADLTGKLPPAWTSAFDLVHQRFIWASLPDPAPALKNLLQATKPSGWVQLVDVDLVSYPEAQYQPPAFSMLRKLARALFADPTAAAKQRKWLEESGLVDVDEATFDIAAGVGHKDPSVGSKGSQDLQEVLEMFMQSYAQKSPDMLGLERSKWDDLPLVMRSEMEKYPLTVRINIVWGRKPAGSN